MSESLFDRAIELIKTSSKPLSETELSNALQCTTADIRALQPSISSNLNIICKSVTDAKLDYVLADTTDETNLRLQLIAIDKQQRAEIESLLRQKSELEAKKNRHIKLLHDYNEAKDVAQSIFGQLASIENVTTKAIQLRFDVSLDD